VLEVAVREPTEEGLDLVRAIVDKMDPVHLENSVE
jgi:hypothetical protein